MIASRRHTKFSIRKAVCIMYSIRKRINILNRREEKPIFQFSNVESPVSQLVHIIVSCVCKEGRLGRGSVCLSFSLCLGSKLDILSEAQTIFFHQNSSEQRRSYSLVPFFSVPTNTHSSFLLPESELKTQPTSGAWDYVASSVSLRSSYQHCCFPDVHPFTACQGCGCKFGSLQWVMK